MAGVNVDWGEGGRGGGGGGSGGDWDEDDGGEEKSKHFSTLAQAALCREASESTPVTKDQSKD